MNNLLISNINNSPSPYYYQANVAANNNKVSSPHFKSDSYDKKQEKQTSIDISQIDMDKFKYYFSIFTGFLGYWLASDILNSINANVFSKNLVKSDTKTNISFQKVENLAQKMAKEINKGEKKVKYIFLESKTEKDVKKSIEKMEKEYKRFKRWNGNADKYLNFKYKIGPAVIFRVNKNKYLALTFNKNKASYIFHELGHFMNHKNKFLGKLFNFRLRPILSLIPPIVTFLALIHNPLKNESKPTKKLDKVTSFVSNNATELIILSALPSLLDEVLASSRALKFIKANDLTLFNKLKVTYSKAFMTYIIATTFKILGMKFGLWCKNKVFSQNQTST